MSQHRSVWLAIAEPPSFPTLDHDVELIDTHGEPLERIGVDPET